MTQLEKYLIIQDKIPFVFSGKDDFLKREKYSTYTDEQFNILKQEFNSLLKERDNPNLLSVGISYSYDNIQLPVVYDIIFDTRDKTKYFEQKTIVRYALNYRTFFHTDLWKGHHSHCFIEIVGDIPEIFNELPENDGGQTLHKGIGLCKQEDWQGIKAMII